MCSPWRFHSARTPQAVAEEFARTAFDRPRRLDAASLVADVVGVACRGRFRLVGDPRIYQLTGCLGVWCITT